MAKNQHSVMITLPPNLLHKVEEYAKELGVSRNAAMKVIINEWSRK